MGLSGKRVLGLINTLGLTAGLSALCVVVTCCSREGESNSNGVKDTVSKENASRLKKEHAEIGDELAQILKDAKAAYAAENRDLAGQLVSNGIGIADEKGRDFEKQKAYLTIIKGNLERDARKEIDARRSYADAMAIFRVLGEHVGRFEVNLAQAELEEMKGDFAAAKRELNEAESLGSKVDSPHLHSILQYSKGRLAARQMKNDVAYEMLLESVQTFSKLKNNELKAEAYVLLATVEDAQGKTKQCRQSLGKALAVYREDKNKKGEVKTLHRLAALAEREKKYATARSLYKKVLALYKELDLVSDATKVGQHMNALPDNSGKKK